MKKSLLFCGVAALAFASCTQNEVLDVNENRAIGFDAFSGKATRAVNDITGNGGDSFTKFFVFGSYDKNGDGSGYTSVYSNDEVVYNSGWSATETQYWVADKNYKFAAYSDGNAALPEGTTATFADATGKLKIAGYVVSNKDLILAEGATGNGTTKGNVTLSFSHLLSKVKFTFSTTFNADLTVTVTNLTFSPENKGTWDNSAWSVTSGNTAAKTISSYVAKSSDPVASEEFYVLPQDNASLKASFTVTVTDPGGAELFKKNFTDISLASGEDTNTSTTSKWVEGYAYNYNAVIKPENMDGGTTSDPIVFSPSVDVWENGTVSDNDIVNP